MIARGKAADSRVREKRGPWRDSLIGSNMRIDRLLTWIANRMVMPLSI